MDGTNAIISLPSELWSRIFRICVFELDDDLPPTHHSHGFRPIKPVLRNDSAIALACVCSYWKSLVVSDHRFTVIRIYRENFSQSLALQPDDIVGGADPRIAIQIAVRKRGGLEVTPEADWIQRLLNHFAARIEALLLGLSEEEDVEAVFTALDNTDFKRLYFLEIISQSHGIFYIPNTRIRAPQLTTLKLVDVKVFQSDGSNFQRFLRVVGVLPRLLHLTLIRYSEHTQPIHDALLDRSLTDNLRTNLTALKTLNLAGHSDSIIALLRYLILPSLNDLTLSYSEWALASPDEWCYQSPGLDFPKLGRLNLSDLNLCAERLMSFANLPALSHLIFRTPSYLGAYHPYRSQHSQLSSLEISLPNLRHLSIGLLLAEGQCPLRDLSSRIRTSLLTSLCLTPFASPLPLSDKSINLHPDAFSSVRSLTIYIESSMIRKFDGSHFDSICASLNGVVHLQVCFQLAEVRQATKMHFLCPSGLVDDADGRPRVQLMPNLKKLSLLAQFTGWSPAEGWRVSGDNCIDVKQFVKERSSIGSRPESIVFNRPVAPKALSYLRQYVDHVSVDQNAWEGIYAMTGKPRLA